ncbi:CD225/dispanin family protein [Nocardiopsis oceani]
MSYGPPPPGNPGPPPPPPGGGYGPPTGGYGPPSGGYGPPSGGYGPPSGGYGGFGGQPPAEPPKNYLLFNILGIFGCMVLGIIGLVFALQVNSKWQMGDYAGAESAANTAKILGIIGLVCFIINVTFWIIYIFGIMLAVGTATY